MSFAYPYQQQQHSQQQQQQQQQRPSAIRNSSSQLWMGELDQYWDESFIKSIWQSFGFHDVNVKMIKDFKTQGYNAGYCFVEFPTLDQASQALSKNGAIIPNTNRPLKLNWASGGGLKSSNELSIFVGDLSPDITDHSLYEFFGTKYSSVSGSKIMVDQATGQSKGYGFVRFLNEMDQQRALVEMQGAIINGRPIRVSTAVPKNRQQFPQQQVQQPLQLQQQQQRFNQVAQQQVQLPVPQQLLPTQQQILGSLDAQFQPPLNQFTDPNNTTVFIGGLSSIVTEDDLRLYFQPFGDITYVKIPLGKGCGFVQYTTRASAELAISKMQGYPIGNSRIRLSWGRSSNKVKNVNLPVLYGFQQGHQIPQLPQSQIQQLSQPLNQVPAPQQQQQGSVNGAINGHPGLAEFQFNQDLSEPMDQSRLNQLYLAARDGRLDAIDQSNGYIFA
jgi:RNA recognition motif-containing protein